MRPLTLPEVAPVKLAIDATIPVKVEAADLCGRFVGRVIQGVNPKAQTPGLDGGALGALWPTPCVASGRYLELCDVRIRATFTCSIWIRSTVG